MTSKEADRIAATVHLLHAITAADAAVASLLTACDYEPNEQEKKTIKRISDIIDGCDTVYSDIVDSLDIQDERKEQRK